MTEAEMDRNKKAIAAEMVIARRVEAQKVIKEIQNKLLRMHEELKRLCNVEPQGPSDEREQLEKNIAKHKDWLEEKLKELAQLREAERQGRPDELVR